MSSKKGTLSNPINPSVKCSGGKLLTVIVEAVQLLACSSVPNRLDILLAWGGDGSLRCQAPSTASHPAKLCFCRCPLAQKASRGADPWFVLGHRNDRDLFHLLPFSLCKKDFWLKGIFSILWVSLRGKTGQRRGNRWGECFGLQARVERISMFISIYPTQFTLENKRWEADGSRVHKDNSLCLWSESSRNLFCLEVLNGTMSVFKTYRKA
jgi:hypothetical protein